jgi:hypothetical protein
MTPPLESASAVLLDLISMPTLLSANALHPLLTTTPTLRVALLALLLEFGMIGATLVTALLTCPTETLKDNALPAPPLLIFGTEDNVWAAHLEATTTLNADVVALALRVCLTTCTSIHALSLNDSIGHTYL